GTAPPPRGAEAGDVRAQPPLRAGQECPRADPRRLALPGAVLPLLRRGARRRALPSLAARGPRGPAGSGGRARLRDGRARLLARRAAPSLPRPPARCAGLDAGGGGGGIGRRERRSLHPALLVRLRGRDRGRLLLPRRRVLLLPLRRRRERPARAPPRRGR